MLEVLSDDDEDAYEGMGVDDMHGLLARFQTLSEGSGTESAGAEEPERVPEAISEPVASSGPDEGHAEPDAPVVDLVAATPENASEATAPPVPISWEDSARALEEVSMEEASEVAPAPPATPHKGMVLHGPPGSTLVAIWVSIN